MKLLFLSTPVGAFGSGAGGGVELTVQNIACELQRRSHSVHLVACAGSHTSDFTLVTIPGEVHAFAQNQTRSDPVSFPGDSVLAAMWEYARQVQDSYDLLVNFAYDWLPFYLTPFFRTPIAHFVSMGSLLDAIDRVLLQVEKAFPQTIGVYTHTQAHTFGDRQAFRILGSGIDLDAYSFCEVAEDKLAWIARIAPEKGLEDAAAVSAATGKEIIVLGKMQDEAYWDAICRDFPTARLTYLGFHPTARLQELLGPCQALLMTPKWVEAFGNVAIEALACGVPVISYARGGPVEIVRHNETGFLVEPDNLEGLTTAVENVGRLSRFACRRQADAQFSMPALGDRFEAWLHDILRSRVK